MSVDPRRPEKSSILRFPSGDLVKHVRLGGNISAVSRGDAVIVRPLRDWALGLVDLERGAIVTASQRDAFDAHDDLRVSEQLNGSVALFRAGSDTPIAVTALSRTRLGRLHAVDVSPDLKRIALSGRDRGGLWNLSHGAREVHIRGFDAAYMEDGALFADFPMRRALENGKSVELPRAMVRLDLKSKQTIERPVGNDEQVQQSGRFVLVSTPARADEPERDVTLAVRDVRTDGSLWTRFFEGDMPYLYFDDVTGRLALEYPMSSATARGAMEQQPALRAQAAAGKLKSDDAYLEILDLATGEVAGRMLVNTGRDQMRIRSVTSSGDAVAIVDRFNHVFVYSLASGDRRGRAFGQLALPSEAAGLVCVQNEPNEIDCYDLQTMEHQAEIRLSASVRVMRFSADGRGLLVVTSDQVAKIFDTAALRLSR